MMGHHIHGPCHVLLILILSFCSIAHADALQDIVSTYIVHASKDMKPSPFVTHRDWYAQTLYSVKGISAPDSTTSNVLGPLVDPGIVYVYNRVFHGFAATMTAPQASALSSVPGFLSTLLDGTSELHTTRTPAYLGLRGSGMSPTSSDSSSLWQRSRFGEDVIVGVFDSGIWPERSSFSDAGMSPVPARWKGACETGIAFRSSSCNRKVIGARVLYKGYESSRGPINDTADFKSARDGEGHGTHTSSTVAGRAVANASLFGYASGQASGMAPLARLAIYKVCWAGGCFNSDILAAFEAAIADGVDVLSLSLGGVVGPHFADPIAIGAFAAMEHGIVTSASAGNSGPTPLSVSNLAPWVLTVGASTLDRSFPAPVTLGNGMSYAGVSLFSGKEKINRIPLQLVYGAEAAIGGKNYTEASLCLTGALNSSVVAGKIVLCDRGVSARSAKSTVVKQAGGAAMILANMQDNGEELAADSFLAPGTLVGFKAGESIKAYIRSTRGHPTASIAFQGTLVDVKPSPTMAAFSSRGPNPMVPEILKPDLTAPGVNILAAWTGKVGPSSQPSDTRVVDFNIISGTSMSCPHVSGLAALLKGVYPHWSPSAIKSALMTTATFLDKNGNYILDGADGSISNPFVHGAGHVVPQSAMNPGLVYDIRIQDYVDYLCGLNYTTPELEIFTKGQYKCSGAKAHRPGDLNYPSFSVFFMQDSAHPFSATYYRTVQNVGKGRCTYKVEVVEPKGVKVTIVPPVLIFKYANQKLTYKATFEAAPLKSTAPFITSSGSLSWKDGTHVVQTPIVFIWFITM